MKKLKLSVYLAGISAFLVTLIGFNGCDTDSPETLVREVGLFIGGFYRHPTEGNFMVPRTSGLPISSMNLIQSGDQLNAFDNYGFIYRGTIGRVLDGSQASITLRGQSSAGNEATISGIVVVSGNTATMEGTWLEDAAVSPVFGQALVPTNAPSQPPGGGGNVNITPPSVTLNAGGGTQSFTASGGSGDFTWSLVDSGLGAITSTTGSRRQNSVYTAQGVGTQTITVRDVNGDGDTSSIIQTTEGAGGPIPP